MTRRLARPVKFHPTRHTSIWATAAFGLLTVFFGPSTVLAEEDRDSGFELVAGIGISRSSQGVDSDVTALGFRGHRWLNDKWGAEVSYLRTEEGFIRDDSHYLDLSALYRLTENPRFSSFVFGGVGALRYTTLVVLPDIPGSSSLPRLGPSDTTTTAHVGIGLNLRLGDNFYFRPDLRARRHFDMDDDFGYFDDSSFDANIGFGWKF